MDAGVMVGVAARGALVGYDAASQPRPIQTVMSPLGNDPS